MRGGHNPSRWFGVLLLAAAAAALTTRAAFPIEPSIDDLKAKLSTATVGEKPHLCVQIAQRQLSEAGKLYASADSQSAAPVLNDVVTFSEMARDYAIQSHKYQKQTEIAVRGMTRKLTDLMHSLPREEQGPLHAAITRLQRVRDDLLTAMFPKGEK